MPEHPGGMAIIMKYAGKDATAAYDPIHREALVLGHLPHCYLRTKADFPLRNRSQGHH